MKTVIRNDDGTETVIALEDGNLITGTINHNAHAIAEWAKAKHNSGEFGSSDMKHAGCFDPVAIEAYINTNNITMSEFMKSQEHMRRFLMDPDLSAFRIWKGRI